MEYEQNRRKNMNKTEEIKEINLNAWRQKQNIRGKVK